jgi:hypothetical protein
MVLQYTLSVLFELFVYNGYDIGFVR